MIIRKPSQRIVATILAKNEEDIIARCIEHHLEQGVYRILLTDNNSTDNTREIANRYPEVEILDEPGTDHHQAVWVTRMARLACKFDPHWIIHLDADELWCGLHQLRQFMNPVVGCCRMFLHPPGEDMRYYLDFSNIPGFTDECKIAHAPDPNIEISHGNHGANRTTEFTTAVWRHHYPIRSFEQFRRKAVEGHRSLQRRGSVCERWKKWHDLEEKGELQPYYNEIVAAWKRITESPKSYSKDDLLCLLQSWSTPDVCAAFHVSDKLPSVGVWPVHSSARQHHG